MLSRPDLEGAAIFPAILEAIGVDTVYLPGPFASIDPVSLLLSDYTIDCDRAGTVSK
jgi:hypothetical protein